MDTAALYRDLVDTAAEATWVVDLDAATVLASAGVTTMHGAPPPARVADVLDDDGRAWIAEVMDAARARTPLPASLETVWRRADRSARWVEARALLVATEPPVVVLRFADRTEQRATLAALRASEAELADQAHQNELMQAVASAANEAATLLDVLRHARDLVLLHDDWERARAFVPTDEGLSAVQVSEEQAAEDAADPRSPAELELAERCRDLRAPLWDERRLTLAFPVLLGEEVCAVVSITSAPPLYRHAMIERMAVQVAEQLARVADRERTRRELSSARDEAMEASRQKSDFLATMSHEIRTPLNGVIGLNDLLLRSGLTTEQHRLASGVQVASRALLGVINDILDFSKIEAGRLDLEELDFEVRPLLDQVGHMLAQTARARGLDLVVSCHPAVPAVLRGDPTRLAQVVTNLVSNAVKFTERGGVIVRATTRAVDDRLRLDVEVSDTGVGVAAEKVERLFDAFTQADASTTRLYGGTGLGLAISREIAEAMGGDIVYQPNLGGGSIFTLRVLMDPARGDDVVGDEDALARELLSGRRALVVDDTEHNRLILEEQLGWWGVACDSAASAQEGLALLSARHAEGSQPYDAVLLDLAMPETDGLDLARRIRASAAFDEVRLLMLTSVTAVDPDEVREAGVDDLLTKPVLSSVLRTALSALLGGADADAPPAAPAAPARGRVLVVEDNPVNQMVATGLLTALGYECETAADGLAALEAFGASTFDAVLMDVQMPRMDGYAATRALRETDAGRHVPVIAMTAAAIEGERDRCLAAGMDDFLTKPVDPLALGEALARWTGQEPDEPVAAPPSGPDGAAGVLDEDRLTMLVEVDPDSTEYLQRAIGNFLRGWPEALAGVQRALDDADADEAFRLLHRLAGGALNLGVLAGEDVRALEERARAGDLDAVAAGLGTTRQRLTVASRALEQRLASLQERDYRPSA